MMLAAKPCSVRVFIMLISYSITEKDFVDAGMLMQRKRGRAGQILQWLGGFTLFAIVFNFIFNPTSRAALLHVDSIPKVFMGMGLPVILVCLPLLTKRTLRRQFRRNPTLAETRTLEADASGLRFKAQSSSSDMAWTTYAAFAEDDRTFLLVHPGNLLFVPIPKTQMSSSEIKELQTVFQVHLPRK
jgi:hypothetical protein